MQPTQNLHLLKLLEDLSIAPRSQSISPNILFGDFNYYAPEVPVLPGDVVGHEITKLQCDQLPVFRFCRSESDQGIALHESFCTLPQEIALFQRHQSKA